MIRLSNAAGSAAVAAAVEPAYGSVIETLFACYGSFPQLADFYLTEGGSLCHFAGELILSGSRCRTDEIISFAKALGVAKLICAAGSLADPISHMIAEERRRLLIYPHRQCQAPQCQINESPRLDDVFNMICEADASASKNINPAAFITDVGRRRILGFAKVYTADNASTAGVYATGSDYALIGCVATLPEHRGKGLAASLVRACVRYCLDLGRTPALVAENSGVIDFYLKLGFIPAGESLTFILN